MDDLVREQVLVLPPNAPHPRVCIIACFNDTYAPLAEIARPNWMAYAQRHSYAIRWYPQLFHLDSSRPQTYGDKCRFQAYYDIRGHCEIVMYLDIDSLFMNMDVTIEEQIGPVPFYYTYDDGGPQSGLWIARTDATTEKHLRYAYEYAATNNNVRHGKIEPNGISDQDAFTRLMHVPPFSQTFGIQNCWPAEQEGHCSPETFSEGKWIVQFGGKPLATKIQLMKEWCTRV